MNLTICSSMFRMFSDVNSVLRLDLDSLAGKRVHVSEDEHRLGEFMVNIEFLLIKITVSTIFIFHIMDWLCKIQVF